MPPLDAALFDYLLPPQLIAQAPAARRDESRLLIVHRATRLLEHRAFSDLPEFLCGGDTLIRNNASVLPARLRAVRPSGGQVECFLLNADGDEFNWRCLVKPGRKLAVGATFADPANAFSAKIIARHDDGGATVRFTTTGGESVPALANRLGAVPLPPYIMRKDDPATRADRERYQTVYADRAKQVAVAAPTAGLHFTPELLATLAARGVVFADATLHVGLGTFKPIESATVEEHRIHRETYELPAATQRILFPPHSGRRIAVGTTAVRTIEDFLARHSSPLGSDRACRAEADIFIYPPRQFRGADALITNFHQPRSTLLCLVAAFLTPGSTAGIAWWRDIYAEAIAREYRFLSYGDAMLIL
ncbi:MAG: tRNA preQ1(34) S-adenosylmethionine ribosyltransferase-isomerase QueA [Opitutaceae bacterium]|nr:tRNA preQ1(34) S-adenosylmethionine ribosyltransferase-isomerase QueA [Opitutaceae bacterium]